MNSGESPICVWCRVEYFYRGRFFGFDALFFPTDPLNSFLIGSLETRQWPQAAPPADSLLFYKFDK